MVAYAPRQRLTFPIAPLAAGIVWIILAAVFAGLSPAALDGLATGSGLPRLMPFAKPPLGFTARLVLILIGGGGAALITWLALSLGMDDRAVALSWPGRRRGPAQEDAVPVLRKADAHPDAPARAPIRADRDFGAPPPPLPDVVEMAEHVAIPADLDEKLAAFDPAALPAVPRAPVPPVAPLARVQPKPAVAPGERLETFELTPMVRPAAPEPAPITAAATRETIQVLLARLERGMQARDASASAA